MLRSILRRAERYGRQHLGTAKPFLHELVPTVVDSMGHAFPELKTMPDSVVKVILGEEQQFIRTLDRGLKLFDEVARRTQQTGSNVISGEDTFNLHTTYGFFADITQQMASEIGMTVDMDGYRKRMEEFQAETGKVQKKMVITAVAGELPRTDDSLKYGSMETRARVLGWIKDNSVARSGRLVTGDESALLMDLTNFYAEQGGQVGDVGTVSTGSGVFDVEDTQKLGDAILHIGRVADGWIEPGQQATLEASSIRADTMRNHTATHLLNCALRKVLGDHIEQKGSLVDPDKTRFDFTHNGPLSAEEIAAVERLVNEKVYADLPVKPVTLPLAEAKKIPGVRAVFGEKYPDPVRVLLVGAERPEDVTAEHSVEFCGGTHLTHTGQAGFFKIISQEAVGKGVRRITAVTGKQAVATVQQLASLVDGLTSRLTCKPEEIPARLEALQEEIKKLQQQLKKGAAADLQGTADKLLAGASEVHGAKIIIGELSGGSDDQVRTQIDRLKQKAGSAVVVVGWTDDSKVQLIAAVTDDLVKKGLHAGKLVGQVAKVVGGGGGGKPTMAQAGGKEPAKLGEALQLAQSLINQQLGK